MFVLCSLCVEKIFGVSVVELVCVRLLLCMIRYKIVTQNYHLTKYQTKCIYIMKNQ